MTCTKSLLAVSIAAIACAQADYDFVLKGGHVIDGKNKISAVRDIAIKDGKIAAVAAAIPASDAGKVIDLKGLYVTPGLVDIHVHVYKRTNPPPRAPLVAARLETAAVVEAEPAG